MRRSPMNVHGAVFWMMTVDSSSVGSSAGRSMRDALVARLPFEQKIAGNRLHVEQRSRFAATQAGSLDPVNDVGIHAESGAEREVAVVGAAQPDRAGPAVAQCLEDDRGAFGPVRRQAERSGEHIRGAARHDRERRHIRADAVREAAR